MMYDTNNDLFVTTLSINVNGNCKMNRNTNEKKDQENMFNFITLS